MRYLLFDQARRRLEEIVDYTRGHWGEEQAATYIAGMTSRFEAIANRTIVWRALSSDFGIDGFFCKFGRHFIYWKMMDAETPGIVTILHERMHQMELLRDAFIDPN